MASGGFQFSDPAAASGTSGKVQQLVSHAQQCMQRYDLDAALKFYEKAVGLEPDNTDLLDAAGEVCVEAGRSEDATKLFTRSVELKPNENSCKYMNLGMLAAGHECLNFYRKGMELMGSELQAAIASGDAPQVAKLKVNHLISLSSMRSCCGRFLTRIEISGRTRCAQLIVPSASCT